MPLFEFDEFLQRRIGIGTLKVDMLAPVVLGRKCYGKCLGEVFRHRPILRVAA